MVLSGGWRVFVGALVLSAGVVAPATASADPAACTTWNQVELPVPPAVKFGHVTAASGSFAVGNGSFWSMYGSTILIWKDGQEFDQLAVFRGGPIWAHDVNSSGVVLVTSPSSASRWQQAGGYEPLRGLSGEYQVKAVDLNERGDVLGLSAGLPVLWPAGSSTPQRVPGLDESWTVRGLADDGSVLASNSSGTYWIGASGAVPLGATAEVRAVRGAHAVGTLDAGTEDAKAVRWNTSGEITATYPYFVTPAAVNTRGHVLSQDSWGMSVWFDAESGREVLNSSGANYAALTDDDDIYTSWGGGSDRGTPLLLDCANGTR
ncbi:hypothetical protein [Lentzea terrae]|uniref:hypothetical protein n=1 Tax=Lentzea terrae TaxID=2200761 RepID=UPI0013007B4E|nr:hypothetical protein [Lentzea terrae]